MKNLKRKIMAVFLVAVLITAVLPVSIFASGSYSVSVSSMTLTQGSSGTFTFTASNAVGAFEISTDGGVSASCSSEKWVDNSSVTITVKGNSVGTGHVYISVYDGADYDGNDLSGKSYTVTVTVKSASGGTVQQTTTVSKTEATTTTQETTTADPETELLTVSVDEEEYLILKEIPENYIAAGFEVEETVYNTVSVQTLVCSDIVLYLLENTQTEGIDYYILNDSGGFELLKYTTLSGQICIFLDFPENFEVPDGYSLVEIEIYDCESVQALICEEEEDESAAETDDEQTSSEEESSSGEGEVEIKSFYTVGEGESDAESGEADAEAAADGSESVVTIDDLASSADGHYYVYCMLAGEKVLCDYDSYYESLSRCTDILKAEVSETLETEQILEEETDPGLSWDSLSAMEQLLCYVIGGCVIVILILFIILIVLLAKRGKKNKKQKRSEDLGDIEFIQEDIFEPEEFKDFSKAFEEADKALGAIDERSIEDDPEGQVLDGKDPSLENEAGLQDIVKEAEEELKEEDAGREAEEEFDGNIDVEDISEILADEFDDIMKYVEKE